MKTQCIYCSEIQYMALKQLMIIPDDAIIFPDFGLMYESIRQLPRYDGKMIFTSNPIVCTNYHENELYKIFDGEIVPLGFSLYGAGLDIAVKKLDSNTNCTLSQYHVDKIRYHLDISDQSAYDYIESLCDSVERAYMLKKLKK